MTLPTKHLTSLPPELKIKLLKLSTSVADLSSLIHASPTYHNVYVANREVILSTVTLYELLLKDVDILKDMPFAVFRLHRGVDTAMFKDAVISARSQHQGNTTIKLDVKQCIALKTLDTWWEHTITTVPTPPFCPLTLRESMLQATTPPRQVFVNLPSAWSHLDKRHVLNCGPCSDGQVLDMVHLSGLRQGLYDKGLTDLCLEIGCCWPAGYFDGVV